MRTAYHIGTGGTDCTSEEVCGLQSCGVSQKVEKWSLLWIAVTKGAHGKQEARRAQSSRGGSSDFFNYLGF